MRQITARGGQIITSAAGAAVSVTSVGRAGDVRGPGEGC